MSRWRSFILLLAAICLAAPEGAEAKNHRGGGGMGGGGNMKKDVMGGKKKGNADAASVNPMDPSASRAIHERTGLIETGLKPVYPDTAVCLEVKSPFASPTRFDGSERVQWAYHGYHNGFDISAPIGTPLIAIADGEVIHRYTGGQLVGHQIFIRHAPEDTGLPVWVYSKYKHFNKLPDLGVGQRVKMGQFLGPSGDSGTAGGHFPTGYPHLHLSVYTSTSAEYESAENTITPKDVQQVDPVVLFLNKNPPVTNSHAARDLPDADKNVVIAYKTAAGKAVPDSARIIWPVACTPK
ncbi:MAG: M23 family metallopeptidase [Proteobacteria bacterium]|nr:M23 family metallopeptidase [Pseudomonadota bacterium]